MYQKVLIASDPEGLADQVVSVVASLVRGTGAQVRAVAVDVAVAPPYVRRDLALSLNHLVRDLRARGVDAEGTVRATHRDHIADELAAEASAWGADLIVLGSHRRGDVRSLLVGSVGHALARRTDRPLLFVGGPHPSDEPAVTGERRVLLAVDYDPGSQRAIETAIEISGPETSVHVVHVVTLPAAGVAEQYVSPEVEEGGRTAGRYLIEGALQRLADHGIRATWELFDPPGDVAHVIVRAADDFDAGVIVLGSRRLAPAWAVVAGSVAHQVIALTHRSVLLAGPQPPLPSSRGGERDIASGTPA